MKTFDLTGKTALITGGAGLLGIEHAGALLASGANVILTDSNKESLKKAKHSLSKENFSSKLYIEELDVSSEDKIKTLCKKLLKSKKRIDILINNAALNPTSNSLVGNIRTTRLENFSITRWNKEISIGLTGAFLCSKVFGSGMAKDGKGGVILNIASDLSVIAPNQNLYKQEDIPFEKQAVKPVSYSVIKTGLIGLTRYLSSYWPDKGIRANALSPGGIYSGQDDEFVARIQELIPLGRMAKKDEYRGAIQFLCSDASKYMNGQNIIIDGGRSVI
tara:strand:+ start:6515 stop:7342 length:828 start_codon:yes stop_codon:yes gene_type:complete